MLSVVSFEVGTSYSAQSVPYMEGNALCCCKDSANLCSFDYATVCYDVLLDAGFAGLISSCPSLYI